MLGGQVSVGLLGLCTWPEQEFPQAAGPSLGGQAAGHVAVPAPQVATPNVAGLVVGQVPAIGRTNGCCK